MVSVGRRIVVFALKNPHPHLPYHLPGDLIAMNHGNLNGVGLTMHDEIRVVIVAAAEVPFVIGMIFR